MGHFVPVLAHAGAAGSPDGMLRWPRAIMRLVAQSKKEQAPTASWPVSQVGCRERMVFLGATSEQDQGAQPCPQPPAATPTKHTLAARTSPGPSQGSTRCSVVASVTQPPAVSFWLASEASTPAQRYRSPSKKDKIQGAGNMWRQRGGEWNWKVEKTWSASGGNQGRKQGDHSSGWSLFSSTANIFLAGQTLLAASMTDMETPRAKQSLQGATLFSPLCHKRYSTRGLEDLVKWHQVPLAQSRACSRKREVPWLPTASSPLHHKLNY